MEVKLGEECVAGVLIAERLSKKIRDDRIHFFRYGFEGIDLKQPQSVWESPPC